MTKSLKAWKPKPFTILCVIHFQSNFLTYLICPPSYYQKSRFHKHTALLIPSCWLNFILPICIRRTDPIPFSISMSSESPSIVQSTWVLGSTSEYYYHSICCSAVTKSCWVVDSYRRLSGLSLQFLPGEWRFFDIKAPEVVDCLSSCVATKS